ncbi:hypothetical protein ABMA27_011409 [Loxostege sticticalis]|uniref:Reverse transcriptase domain-containing protein n=1 Tax=Loxostege sticticalis TaxID=481309 RepID=A0ABR3IG72_LOXSC
MALKFLQANINHSARAQDLLFQSMAQWLIDVVVVAEPYFVPPADNWVSDRDGLVALISSASSSPPLNVVRGHGFASALVGGIVVIGVYFSPNRPLHEFENFMTEVEALVLRSHPHPVIVAGDLNAKSTAWGSPATDPRGRVLEEWLITLGLAVLNRGTVHTCVSWNGGSIVDVSFASPAIASRVHGWRVLKDVENLSNHRYVRFDLHASSRFRGAMFAICDASMPRASTRPPRKWVYWWSPELSRLREACITARRRYARYRRRRRRNEDEEATLRTALVEAKSALSELLATLNRDPWGRPYRMVRKKFLPYSAPLTRCLQPQLLDDVVAALFPRIADFRPPSIAPSSVVQSGDITGEIPEITEGELGAAILRLRAKKTAPGPDGIPGRALVLALDVLGEQLRGLFNACLAQGKFPKAWKTGRLVLLRKQGRPADSPSGFRPLVVLDEAGKLLERIIANRIVRHLETVGPDLSDCQYGFRRGRSTIHAILRVKSVAQIAVSQGEVVLVVSLDITNAFNTLPWTCILEALRFHGPPGDTVRCPTRQPACWSVPYPGTLKRVLSRHCFIGVRRRWPGVFDRHLVR